VITNFIGADDATEDDVEDIFNLLDVNGDGTIDRKELQSLFKMFFKVLEERKIEISVSNDSDIIVSE
jgi:Ca2+-binding EF-hand superfamily protein